MEEFSKDKNYAETEICFKFLMVIYRVGKTLLFFKDLSKEEDGLQLTEKIRTQITDFFLAIR